MKDDHFDYILERNIELTNRFILTVLSDYDKTFKSASDDKYICVLCNTQCSRRQKTRHDKTNKHLKNIEKMSESFTKKLNSFLIGNRSDHFDVK